MAGSDVKAPAFTPPDNPFGMEPSTHPTAGGPTVPIGDGPPPPNPFSDEEGITAPPIDAATQPDQPADPSLQDAPSSTPWLKMGTIGVGSVMGGIAGAGAGGLLESPVTVPMGSAAGAGLGAGVYDVVSNLVGALTGQKNEQGEPITMSQTSMDMLQNGLLSAGGGAGTQVGKALTEGIASQAARAVGKIAGGAVGTGLATMTAQQAGAAAKVFGLLPANMRTADMWQGIHEATVNGGLDALVATAMHSTLPAKATAKLFINKFFGITPEHMDALVMAKKYGMDIGINNVTDSTINNIYRSMVSVVPWMGKPFLDLYDKNVKAVNAFAKTMGASVSSDGSVPSASEASKAAVDTANDAWKAIADTYNDKFNALAARARDTHVQFSSDSRLGIDANGNPAPSLKQWADVVLNNAKRAGVPQMVNGKLVKPGLDSAGTSPLNQQLIDFATKVKNLPQYLYMDEINSLGKEADTLYAKAAKDGTTLSELNSFRTSMHGALTDSHAPGTSWPDVGNTFLALDKDAATARNKFQNKTGTTVLNKDTNIPDDVVGNSLFKMDSPDQVRHLRVIIGDKNMNAGSSVFISRAVNEHMNGIGIDQKFDLQGFRKELGLNDPTSNRYKAVQEALQSSDLKMTDIENFVNVASTALRNPPPKLATMIARRVSLAGFVSALSVISPLTGAAIGHSMFGAGMGETVTAAGLLLGWKGSQILTNPAYLKDMTTFLTDTAGYAERRAALMRVAIAVLPNDLNPRTLPVQNTADPKSKTGSTWKAPSIPELEQRGSSFLNQSLGQ